MFATDVAGVIFVGLGSIVLAFTLGPGESYTLDQLREFFAAPHFVMYLAGQVVVIVMMLATIVDSVAYQWRDSFTSKLMAPIYYRLEDSQDAHDRLLVRVRRLETRLRALSREPKLPPSYGSVDDVNDEMNVRRGLGAHNNEELLIEELSEMSLNTDMSVDQCDARNRRSTWADQYIFSACAGAIGALSVLFAGCVSKLLITTIHGDNQLVYSISYVFIAGMILCVMAQTHLLNRGLVIGDAMSVLPVFIAFWTSLSVVGGIIFYQQGTGGTLWVATGLICMVVGIILLVQHERLKEDEDPIDAIDMESYHSAVRSHRRNGSWDGSMRSGIGHGRSRNNSGSMMELASSAKNAL